MAKFGLPVSGAGAGPARHSREVASRKSSRAPIVADTHRDRAPAVDVQVRRPGSRKVDEIEVGEPIASVRR